MSTPPPAAHEAEDAPEVRPDDAPAPAPTTPAAPPPRAASPRGWLAPETRSRRLLLAAALYAACVLVYALVAGEGRMLVHTPYNHYAHLAQAWLNGRHDLADGAPAYAFNNDFAVFQGKTYISFPPFPAVLMLPLVALSGSPENFRDGQFVVWLAGVGPAVLFLVLEKLRRGERSKRSETENLVLGALFAFGTVYFFTAVQGTVWFAAHVVGVGLAALYVLFALDAERPWLAGLAMGAIFLTRPTMMLTSALFAVEAVRVSCAGGFASEGTLVERAGATLARLDRGKLARLVLAFAAPVALALAAASWMNHARFGTWNPTAMGHELLTVAWRGRMQKWGLFGYHYFPKNLGIFLTSLPYLPPKGAAGEGVAPFQVNTHGLALWFTTPLYLALLWPRRRDALVVALALAVAGPLVMNLMYQNSGWSQFGYRFSNDYAVLLFVLLAVAGPKLGRVAAALAAWGLVWNTFGAVSFERSAYAKYYFQDGSQQIVYQPD